MASTASAQSSTLDRLLQLPVVNVPYASLDKMLLSIIGMLLFTGVVMVCSASMEIAAAKNGNAFHYLNRHLVYLCIAVAGGVLAWWVPLSLWQRSGGLLLLCAIALLVLVLVPGIGKTVNGSMRWVRLGVLNFQVSELAKLFLVIYLAGYLVRRLDEVRQQWTGFVKPLAVMAVMIVLLLAEPDFGAVVVMMTAVLGMMFLGGVRLIQFVSLIAVSAGAIALMAVSQPYRMQRLITFMDPWSEENVYDSGYQLTQALIAFGRGDWSGTGLGNSIQKLFYLPEAHTDFVFAIIAEEMGLFGSVIVIGLLAALALRIFWIGHRAEQQGRFFSAYLAYGIGFIFSAQSLINLGVNTGLLPTKGLTLPLISYGGSSLLVSCIALAIVLRIDFEGNQWALEQAEAAKAKPTGKKTATAKKTRSASA